MYYQVVSQCVQSLKTVEVLLDKAEQFATTKQFDVRVLLNGRLAPDMKPLIYQVQSACDYVKAAAAWLSGQTPPKHEDNEQTLEELSASDNDSERLLPHCDDVRGPPQRRRRRRQDGLPWANEFCPSLTRQAFFSCPDPLGTGWWHGCSGAGRPFTRFDARETRFSEEVHQQSY